MTDPAAPLHRNTVAGVLKRAGYLQGSRRRENGRSYVVPGFGTTQEDAQTVGVTHLIGDPLRSRAELAAHWPDQRALTAAYAAVLRTAGFVVEEYQRGSALALRVRAMPLQ